MVLSSWTCAVRSRKSSARLHGFVFPTYTSFKVCCVTKRRNTNYAYVCVCVCVCVYVCNIYITYMYPTIIKASSYKFIFWVYNVELWFKRTFHC
jgi:hypothetical protein